MADAIIAGVILGAIGALGIVVVAIIGGIKNGRRK